HRRHRVRNRGGTDGPHLRRSEDEHRQEHCQTDDHPDTGRPPHAGHWRMRGPGHHGRAARDRRRCTGRPPPYPRPVHAAAARALRRTGILLHPAYAPRHRRRRADTCPVLRPPPIDHCTHLRLPIPPHTAVLPLGPSDPLARLRRFLIRSPRGNTPETPRTDVRSPSHTIANLFDRSTVRRTSVRAAAPLRSARCSTYACSGCINRLRQAGHTMTPPATMPFPRTRLRAAPALTDTRRTGVCRIFLSALHSNQVAQALRRTDAPDDRTRRAAAGVRARRTAPQHSRED